MAGWGGAISAWLAKSGMASTGCAPVAAAELLPRPRVPRVDLGELFTSRVPISGSYTFAANELQLGDYMSFYMTGYYIITTLNVPPVLHLTIWGKDWDNGIVVFSCSALGYYYFTFRLDASFLNNPVSASNYTIDFSTTGVVSTHNIFSGGVVGLVTTSA